jgi:cyclophilin family peptidyl-prolyl cis-trans isomerase
MKRRRAGCWIGGGGAPRGAALAVFGAVLGLLACRAPSAEPAPSPSARPAPAAPSDAARLRAVTSAELRRASSDVTAADLTSLDATLRRAAARALARIADEHAGELLVPSLADEDPEVVTWSAYGVGMTCAGHENADVRALALRATSLLLERAERHRPALSAPAPLVDPLTSIALALGRCGGADAEPTLRAWLALGAPLSDAAGLALGTLAADRDRLEDATLVALLDAASRREAPVASALQAFTRLSRLDDTVQARLYEVARAALARRGLARTLAIRALAAAGERAVPELAAVMRDSGATPSERADAARGLGRLADAGQRALGDTLAALGDALVGPNAERLLGAEFGVLSSVLATLKPPPDRAGPELVRLAALAVGSSPALARRTIAVRCAAAALLAGRGSQSSVLAACDPDPNGRAGRLARLNVLDRGPLKGERSRQWQALVTCDDPVVREHALELAARHDEVDATGPVTRALGSKTAGEVASAAHLLAEHPERASATGSADAPAPGVTSALTGALERWDSSPNIEVRTNLADAAGRLGLLTAKSRLEAECRSDNPTLRKHAEQALHLFGDRERRCMTFDAPKTPPDELARALTAPVHVELETDAATVALDLDPKLAPTAVTRLVELAKAGFYDGVIVHRVVPGFVVQLGDPEGDGYGGATRPPLRCETSPAPFEAGSVGIALSGRDTGSSQFFVTLAREPHLDGNYALVGHAGPGWEGLAEGDSVKAVRVR